MAKKVINARRQRTPINLSTTTIITTVTMVPTIPRIIKYPLLARALPANQTTIVREPLFRRDYAHGIVRCERVLKRMSVSDLGTVKATEMDFPDLVMAIPLPKQSLLCSKEWPILFRQ